MMVTIFRFPFLWILTLQYFLTSLAVDGPYFASRSTFRCSHTPLYIKTFSLPWFFTRWISAAFHGISFESSTTWWMARCSNLFHQIFFSGESSPVGFYRIMGDVQTFIG